MQAREIMNRDVVTVRIDDTLATAAGLMLRHQINALPVLDEQGEVRGMVGIRDVLRVPWSHRNDRPISRWDRLEEKAAQLRQISVDLVMAWPVASVGPETDVIDVAALMANQGTHPIPVLQGGQMLGIIGRADVARVLLALGESV